MHEFKIPPGDPRLDNVTYPEMVQTFWEFQYLNDRKKYLEDRTALVDRTDTDDEWMAKAEAELLNGNDPIGGHHTRPRSGLTYAEVSESAKQLGKFDRKLDISPDLLGDALDA